MNLDIAEGQWNQFKGTVKSRWAKLTDQNLAFVAGRKERLVAKVEQLYGLTEDEAESEIDEFLVSQGIGGGEPGAFEPEAKRPVNPPRH